MNNTYSLKDYVAFAATHPSNSQSVSKYAAQQIVSLCSGAVCSHGLPCDHGGSDGCETPTRS